MGRIDVDAGPPAAGGRRVDSGSDGRFIAKHDRPCVGDRFGDLTVVGLELGPLGGLRWVRCRCTCGVESRVAVGNLRKGASTRCNTCAKQATGAYIKRYRSYSDVVPDDEHRRRLLNRLAAAIGRCHRESDSGYHSYGGRGIAVCEEWRQDRRAYLRYVITLPGWDDPRLELDRINVDGDYAPGNVRFVTRAENARNKRTVRALDAEVRDLRSRLRRAEESLRRAHALGFRDRT